MSKKNIITIFLSAIWTLPLWGGQQYYAFLKGDTLRIGNNYMERAMLWNNGAPVTISLTDKQHGKTIPAQGKQPDFSIVKGIPTDATFTVNEIPTNGIHASYLQATVACTIGSLKYRASLSHLCRLSRHCLRHLSERASGTLSE